MDIDGYNVVPLTPDLFPDVVEVLGPGGVGGCWCMYWATQTGAAWEAGRKGGSSAPNKQAFRALVAAGPPPGLLAYDEARPVAWARVVARSTLPGLERSRHFKTDLPVDGVWSLPCFVVVRSHRGRGLTAVLVRGAIELARDHGASMLEAYPWEPDERRAPATVYTGVASTFRRLGFVEVQRTVPHKPMMRLDIA